MERQVSKWGNSLALRIPKALADQFGLDTGTRVEFKSERGRLVITPLAGQGGGPHRQLDDLVANITDDNLHHEVTYDAPVGREIW